MTLNAMSETVLTSGPIPESEIQATDDFDHLRFARGYYLTNYQSIDLGAHWATTRLGNYTLGWDRRTPSASVSLGDHSVHLIGRAFHLRLDDYSPEVIVRALFRAANRGREAFDRELYQLSGRYVVVHHGPHGTFLQTDAVGMRSAYYTQNGGTVSSHAALTSHITGINTPSPFGVKNWFRLTKAPSHPGRATEYEGIFALTPNTELNVRSSGVRRVGPLPRNEDRPAVEVAEELIPLLQSQLRSLADRERLLMSLTAGLDSRVSLALSHPVRNDITYFSYATYRGDQPSPSEPDMLAARQMCQDHGLDFRVVMVKEMLTSGPLNNVIRENSRRIHSPSIAAQYRNQLPPDSVHLRSNIYEIGRSFFRNASSKPLPDLGAEEFAKRVIRVREHESYQDGVAAFKDWINVTGFDEVDGYDPYDLYYWELRMGRWLPAHLTESDIAHDTYTVVNSRRILELLLSVSLEDRMAATVFDMLIGMTWPSLFKYPVNGELRKYPRTN